VELNNDKQCLAFEFFTEDFEGWSEEWLTHKLIKRN
jgi:hypothetical protein